MYIHIYHLIIFALLAFPLPTKIMTEHKLGWPTVYIHIIQTEATAKWALCRHIYVLSNYNYRNCRDKMAIQKILCLSLLHIYVCVWLSLPVRCNPNWNLQQAVVKGRVLVHSTCSDCHTCCRLQYLSSICNWLTDLFQPLAGTGAAHNTVTLTTVITNIWKPDLTMFNITCPEMLPVRKVP